MRRFLWDLFVNVALLSCLLTFLTVLIVGLIELAIKAGVISR